MRLKRVALYAPKAASLALLALVLVLSCTHPASSQARKSYQPEVKLACSEPVCGSNPENNEWLGIYRVKKDNFPANTWVLVTVIRPNGKPYGHYSEPGTKYGHSGNLLRTNQSRELPEFEWSAYNGEGKQVDEPGVYRLRFYLKVHGKIVHADTRLVMVDLS